MRAAIFKAAGVPLEVATVPDPEPGEGEVVLKVGRCGICGTDLHVMDGSGPPPPCGSVIGHEFAGEVVALGRNVERLKVGDNIAAIPLRGCGHCGYCRSGLPVRCTEVKSVLGGFGEYAIATERESILLPSTLSMADGALVEPLAVALHGVAMAGIKPGDHVMVIGAGPIGLGAVYWSRRSGAGKVTIVESNPARIEMAMTMGATVAMPPDLSPVGVADIRFGGFYGADVPDIVIECVGREGLLSKAMSLARTGGTVVSLGTCAVPDEIIPVLANLKELTLKFPICYSRRDFEVTADTLDSGAVELRAMITDTMPLTAIATAFDALRAGGRQSKIMIDVQA